MQDVAENLEALELDRTARETIGSGPLQLDLDFRRHREGRGFRCS